MGGAAYKVMFSTPTKKGKNLPNKRENTASSSPASISGEEKGWEFTFSSPLYPPRASGKKKLSNKKYARKYSFLGNPFGTMLSHFNVPLADIYLQNFPRQDVS